jgi:hypothetical protein
LQFRSGVAERRTPRESVTPVSRDDVYRADDEGMSSLHVLLLLTAIAPVSLFAGEKHLTLPPDAVFSKVDEISSVRDVRLVLRSGETVSGNAVSFGHDAMAFRARDGFRRVRYDEISVLRIECGRSSHPILRTTSGAILGGMVTAFFTLNSSYDAQRMAGYTGMAAGGALGWWRSHQRETLILDISPD